jgi:hypothetical protein
VKRPYHDDLEAMRDRLLVLEHAVSNQACEACARRLLHPSTSATHRVLAFILGLLALMLVFAAYTACSNVAPGSMGPG